jgi:hypothetical protein
VNGMIRKLEAADFQKILAIVNEAATVYRDKIPSDCYHTPYMPSKS